ncbi:hypothetical protein D3C80_1785440 [compost metagenome]
MHAEGFIQGGLLHGLPVHLCRQLNAQGGCRVFAEKVCHAGFCFQPWQGFNTRAQIFLARPALHGRPRRRQFDEHFTYIGKAFAGEDLRDLV